MRGDHISYWADLLSQEYRSHLIRPSYNITYTCFFFDDPLLTQLLICQVLIFFNHDSSWGSLTCPPLYICQLFSNLTRFLYQQNTLLVVREFYHNARYGIRIIQFERHIPGFQKVSFNKNTIYI